MFVEVFRKKMQDQNGLSWLLWALLDTIALFSLKAQEGRYRFLVAIIIGQFVVAVVLIFQKGFKWSWFESLVLVLIFGCLYVWYKSDAWWATIASTASVIFAGLFQVRDSWKQPSRKTGIVYTGFFIVYVLVFMGTTEWSVKQRAYPVGAGLLSLSIALSGLRKPKSR